MVDATTQADKDSTLDPKRTPDPLPESPAEGDDTSPDDMAVQDWIEAENSRPTLPDETADGLDDMDEEVRRQAEDRPLDTPGRL